ncbi:MAG TPA: hypothetical protein VN455_13540 [Methanotrichaceae archaeon]|nr:hypothetical protein [Methanotrichaceae archaeon]
MTAKSERVVITVLACLILASLASGMELSATIDGSSGSSSTSILYGSTIDDYNYEQIQLNPDDCTLSNTFSGSGSLPYSSISKSDTKGNFVTAYRSISGKPGVTGWNYDWSTYLPYSSTAGYGVGAGLTLNVANAYSFNGGSYGSNKEGDYANTFSSGSSSSGTTGTSVSNMYTCTNAFNNEVFSRLSANLGTSTGNIYFDASSHNNEGEYAYQLVYAYGTASKAATISNPYIDADAQKTYAGVSGKTDASYGTSAILRTHTENLAKMSGHKGTYYTGGGEFGVNIQNYGKLSGSVLGQAYASNVYLYPSTNVPSYRTAYLLDPFRREWVIKEGYADWGYNAFNDLMDKGLAVTYYRDSAVSHSRVGDMDDYYVSAISSHMNPNAIEVTRAADSDRVVTGSELASMFTKNPQGLIYLDGCSSFYPGASSPLANAVKNKEWLSGGYTYNVNARGDSQFMSNFFGFLAQGYSAKTSASKASTDVYNYLHVNIVPTWTPSNSDFYLL